MLHRKKILQVCNTDFYLTRFLRPLLVALVDAGFEVHAATEGENIPDDLLAICTMHQVTFPKRASFVSFSESIRSLRHLIRKEEYTCVNGHNRNASIVARVAAWREKVPINLYTAHGFYFHDDQGLINWTLTLGLEGFLSLITDYTLSQSQQDTELMRQLRLIRTHRIETIGNGIDTNKFSVEEPRESVEKRLGLAHGVFRIASVGRIVEGKGFIDLVDAYARFVQEDPDHVTSELVIVGGNIDNDISPVANRLRVLLDEYDIADKVKLTGIVDNVQDYLRASDLFVSSSYREGMPRALLEAMCAGLPIIATNIRGSSEIITHGVHGYLYPAHNVAACQTAIRRMFLSPQDRVTMRKRNRELILDHYTDISYIERQVNAIMKLFHLENTGGRDG